LSPVVLLTWTVYIGYNELASAAKKKTNRSRATATDLRRNRYFDDDAIVICQIVLW